MLNKIIIRRKDKKESTLDLYSGVYLISAEKGKDKIDLYVGCSGIYNKKWEDMYKKTTLQRVLSEVQSSGIISIKPFEKFDTDFIIFCCVEYFVEHGYNIIYTHLDDDVNKEIELCQKINPFLQTNKARIFKKLKHKSSIGTWKKTKENWIHAKKILFNDFDDIIEEKNINKGETMNIKDEINKEKEAKINYYNIIETIKRVTNNITIKENKHSSYVYSNGNKLFEIQNKNNPESEILFRKKCYTCFEGTKFNTVSLENVGWSSETNTCRIKIDKNTNFIDLYLILDKIINYKS